MGCRLTLRPPVKLAPSRPGFPWIGGGRIARWRGLESAAGVWGYWGGGRQCELVPAPGPARARSAVLVPGPRFCNKSPPPPLPPPNHHLPRSSRAARCGARRAIHLGPAAADRDEFGTAQPCSRSGQGCLHSSVRPGVLASKVLLLAASCYVGGGCKPSNFALSPPAVKGKGLTISGPECRRSAAVVCSAPTKQHTRAAVFD